MAAAKSGQSSGGGIPVIAAITSSSDCSSAANAAADGVILDLESLARGTSAADQASVLFQELSLLSAGACLALMLVFQYI